MKTPNIVVVMADQLSPQWMGTYDHPLVKTPHIDALASRGMRFDAAYCNSPLCAPSRAAFMTGQLTSNFGAYDNAAEFPASVPTFAHVLRNAGYRTVLSGKMHFVGPDQMHGFEERLTTDVYPADHAWTPDWRNPGARIDKWFHNMDAVTQAGAAATTFQYDYDDEAVFLARRRIFDFAMSGDGPFAMFVSLIHPHDPYVARQEFWDLYDDVDIPMPETGPTDDPHTARVRAGIEADKVNLSEDDIRAARRGYFANVSYFDSKVGEIVETLRAADMLDDTVVIVTSDHGDALGERGLWYKMTFFEHSARVPLVLAGPGVEHGVAEDPVSLIDLTPTFAEIAGAKVPPHMDGGSLWSLAKGQRDPDRVVRADYCAECTAMPVLMIRQGPWKYIHCDGDPAMLFNVVEDPFERTNLAEDPDQAERVSAFAAHVAERWDSAAIRADVIASQDRRRLVHAAMEQGAWTAWDYQPPRDAATEFVRNTVSWDDVLHRMQYPAKARRN